MSLSDYEKETLINFNEEEDTAIIYTCRKDWARTLEQAGLVPYRIYGKSAKDFYVPKEWIQVIVPLQRKTKILTPAKSKAS